MSTDTKTLLRAIDVRTMAKDIRQMKRFGVSVKPQEIKEEIIKPQSVLRNISEKATLDKARTFIEKNSLQGVQKTGFHTSAPKKIEEQKTEEKEWTRPAAQSSELKNEKPAIKSELGIKPSLPRQDAAIKQTLKEPTQKTPHPSTIKPDNPAKSEQEKRKKFMEDVERWMAKSN